MQFHFKKDGSPPGNLWIKENNSPTRWRSASESSTASSHSVDSAPLDKIKVRHIIGRFVQKIVYTPTLENRRQIFRYQNRKYSDYATIPHGSIAGYATFGEIIRILNFNSAVWDQKRRNYVITLTELAIFTPIIDYRMKLNCDVKTYAMSLGGEAQENFYNLIQEIVHYSNSNDNFERLRILKMLQFLAECLEAWNYGSRTFGSTTKNPNFEHKFPAYPSKFTGSYTLWKRRLSQIQRWIKCLEQEGKNYRLEEIKGNRNRLDEIPDEIFYKIKEKLSNGDDVDQINRAYQYDLTLWGIAEDRLWKSLCYYNFKTFVDLYGSDRPKTPGSRN